MLKAIQLGQQLTKKEMKEVKGGGTCAAVNKKGEVSEYLSSQSAQDWASAGGHWCCDSCSKATWLVSMD
jgi:hypothetical protein